MSRSRLGKAAAIGVGLGILSIVFILLREQAPTPSGPRTLPASSTVQVIASTVEVSARLTEPSPQGIVGKRARVEAPSAQPKAAETGTPTESAVMEKLRALKGSDPPLSLNIARQGNQRFPDSPDAAERAWFEARALVDLQRFVEAQELAKDMGERYPKTPWTEDVQRHLLTHPLDPPPASQ